MHTKHFYHSPPCINLSVLDSFIGTPYEKKLLQQILLEWNSHLSISNLCKSWKRERPVGPVESLLFLIYNVEGLNTYISDLVILLHNDQPHICILTSIGAVAKNLQYFPGYIGIAQTGSNAYGGVAILYENILNMKVIEKENNLLITELNIAEEQINIGAIYLSPSSCPPCEVFTK